MRSNLASLDSNLNVTEILSHIPVLVKLMMLTSLDSPTGSFGMLLLLLLKSLMKAQRSVPSVALVTFLQCSSSPLKKGNFNTLFSHFTIIVLILHINSGLDNNFLFGIISNAQLKSK